MLPTLCHSLLRGNSVELDTHCFLSRFSVFLRPHMKRTPAGMAAIDGSTGILLAKIVDSSAFRKTALVILSLLCVSGAIQALV